MMSAQEPGYVRILNVIASAEACGHETFAAWSRQTADPELREVLEIIAGKEREHAFSFARQVRRLGYQPEPVDLPGMQAFRDLFMSTEKSDREKLSFCCPADGSEPFGIGGLTDNQEYDDDTRHLVELFVAEERQTLRLLQEEFERVNNGSSAPPQVG